ncbi:MAG TPA: recombinase family protein [Methanomassiliicoccales archaeon]|nr:recombinase family protein [Methanomassiliicoccales archaeon]
MRAALYARVSTEDQAKEGFSIPAQLKRLNAYCKARNWQSAGEYVDDGYSGRDVKRPAYSRMMGEKDRWDVVVVLKMDRIHRNSRNFAVMMDDLNAAKKEFNSMQESFDTTTAMGRFVMDTIQRIAQLESEQIGERVKIGMTHKAKKGVGYLGFGQPYGYRYENHHLTVIEPEAGIVREIYRRCADGESLSNISEDLNRRGIRPKKNQAWKKGAVHAILRNPLYCGYVEWDGILRKGRHHPIVGSNEFAEAQNALSTRCRTTPVNAVRIPEEVTQDA